MDFVEHDLKSLMETMREKKQVTEMISKHLLLLRRKYFTDLD